MYEEDDAAPGCTTLVGICVYLSSYFESKLFFSCEKQVPSDRRSHPLSSRRYSMYT